MIAARQIALAWLALVLLAGCQVFTSKTPAETLGGVYVSIEATADSVAQRLATGAITADQAQAVSDQLKRAKAYADTATAALAAGSTAEGDQALASAIALLTAIENQMRATP